LFRFAFATILYFQYIHVIMKNARELAQNIKIKNEICKEPFTRILELCNLQISQAEKMSKTECYFQVPEFLFGFPLYDISECITFLVEKLKFNDYYVQYYHPKLLFISWRMDDHVYVDKEKEQEKMLLEMLNALSCNSHIKTIPQMTTSSRALEHIPQSPRLQVPHIPCIPHGPHGPHVPQVQQAKPFPRVPQAQHTSHIPLIRDNNANEDQKEGVCKIVGGSSDEVRVLSNQGGGSSGGKRGRKPNKPVSELKTQGKITLDLSKI